MCHDDVWFTAAQKAELWERWKSGQSAAAISQALERKNKTGVERIVVLHGGIVPAPRRRALAADHAPLKGDIFDTADAGQTIKARIDACHEENPSGWRHPFFQVTATEI